MAKNTKTINISISGKEGTFSSIFSKIKGEGKNSDVSKLRHLLSNEKARLLHIAKTKQPESIYKLAKLLNRDFKAVRHDIKILEEFGFIELVTSNKKNRELLRPVVDADKVVITISL
ncbi:MAG: HTH domain-containing protein [Nanoarchaeota archaeon]|nr:HTH domain-containing protein [Nanoarchaeota archaeon]